MSGIDRQRVRRSFDSQAHEYDRHAIVQKRVLERFVRLLPSSPEPTEILDIGSGTGVLLEKLAVSYPEARLVGLDMAFGMGMAARDRLAGNDRTGFVTADAENLPFAAASFDLVVSTSTFQWLETLEPAFKELHRVLKPGGRFCFALFGRQTLFELRDSYRLAVQAAGVAGSDRTHSFKDVDYVGTALQLAGLEKEYLVSELEIETHPDVPHLLRSIRRIGAGNAVSMAGRGLAERRVMLTMMEHYRKEFGNENGVPATYEVIYGVGRKG
jgi:malonyl-CoA O-methyltransferase